MKKIIMMVLVSTMLLSNVAMASVKPGKTNVDRNTSASTVKEDVRYHVCTEDPFP